MECFGILGTLFSFNSPMPLAQISRCWWESGPMSLAHQQSLALIQSRKGAEGTLSSEPSTDPLEIKSVFLDYLLTPGLMEAKDIDAGL